MGSLQLRCNMMGDVMNGIEIMLKSMGIDPEKIKAELKQTFEATVSGVNDRVNTLQETMNRVESKLDTILVMHIGSEYDHDLQAMEDKDSGQLDSCN